VQTWIDLKFADGEYSFKLGLGQIVEIERKCNAGIGAIYARTLRGRFGMSDDEAMPTEAEYRFVELVEVIRQGLVGGGQGLVDGADVRVSSTRANDLIESYVIGIGDRRMAMKRTWAIAAAILASLIEGYTPPKKDEPGESPATQTNG
jgi:hypothetical protein